MRISTNSDEPFLDLAGTPVQGLRVVFELLDTRGLAVRADKLEKYSTSGSTTTLTDENGVFSTPVAANEGLAPPSLYRVTVHDDNPTPFYAQIPSGTAPMLWADLRGSYESLSPGDMSALSVHLRDASATPLPNHLPDTTNASTGDVVALSSEGLPVWNAPTAGPGGGVAAYEQATQPPVMNPGDIWIQTP